MRSEKHQATFPKTFGYDRLPIWLAVGLALLLIGSGLSFMWKSVSAEAYLSTRIVEGLLFARIAASGVGLLLVALRAKTVLSQNGIEICNGLSTRRFTPDQIRGFRSSVIKGRYGHRTQFDLVPRDRDAWPVAVSPRVMAERKNLPWLAALADVQAEDDKRARDVLESDARFGSTPVARHAAMRNAKTFATYANSAAAAIAVWLFVFPQPYESAVAVGAVAPAVALALVVWFAPLFTLSDVAKGPRPSLYALFLFPALALALRAMEDAELFDWPTALAAAFVGACALTFALMRIDGQISRKPVILLTLLVGSLGYLYGAAAEANMLLDGAHPQVFRAVVKDRFVSGGRRRAPMLRLAPWGPNTMPGDTTVDGAHYRSVKIGDTVCTFLHPGALGLRWYMIGSCPADGA